MGGKKTDIATPCPTLLQSLRNIKLYRHGLMPVTLSLFFRESSIEVKSNGGTEAPPFLENNSTLIQPKLLYIEVQRILTLMR